MKGFSSMIQWWQRALIRGIIHQVCVNLWCTWLIIISRMFQPQDQWQACANIWPPARRHWWPAGQGVGWQKAKLVADWSACVEAGPCSDQDHLLVSKTEQRNQNTGHLAICDRVWIVLQGYSDSCVGIPGSDCSSKGLDIGHLTLEGDAEDTHLGNLGNIYIPIYLSLSPAHFLRALDCFVTQNYSIVTH